MRTVKTSSKKKIDPPQGSDFQSLFGTGKPALLSVSGAPKKKKKNREIELDLSLSPDPKVERKVASSMRQMFKSALKSQARAPIDFRINDQDLPEFPNFWEYCTSPRGLNTMPFPRQLWMLTQLFAEWCPRCSAKGMNEIDAVAVGENLYDMIGHRLVLLEYGVCPKCKGRRSKFIRKERMNMYQELNACLGQRSGKSISTSMGASYVTHKLLKMQRPTMVYGLLPDSLLTMTFVGLTFQRAFGLLWTPFHSMLSSAPWFRDYHSLLDHYAEKYDDDEIYKFGAQAIHYKHRNLFLSPSGPSKRTLRGDTRVFAAIDEIGWFPNEQEDDERERQSANEVYIALDRSLKTVRAAAENLIEQGVDNVLNGTMINISSPAHHRDKIMTLIRESEGSTEQLGVHLPTWEFNPNMPRKAFKKEFRQDAIKAERDFGAVPPMNENPLFSDDDKLLKLFGPHKNKVRYRYVIKTNEVNKKKMRHAVIESVHAGTSLPASVMSLDAGFSNNSFAVAISHPLPGKKRKAMVDVLVEIAPRLKKDVVNYTRVHKEVLVPLIKQFNVKAVITDRWQSKKILHDIMEEFPEILVQEYSLRYEDILEVRDYFMDESDQSIFLPQLEMKPKDIEALDITMGYPHVFKYMPAAHMLYQMKTVQDAGNQVTKGPGLTDDVFRASVLGLSFCLDEEFAAEYLKGEAAVRVGGIGMIAGRSGIYNPIMQNSNAVAIASRSGASAGAVQPTKLGFVGGRIR